MHIPENYAYLALKLGWVTYVNTVDANKTHAAITVIEISEPAFPIPLHTLSEIHSYRVIRNAIWLLVEQKNSFRLLCGHTVRFHAGSSKQTLIEWDFSSLFCCLFFLPSNESNLRIHWVASVDFRHVPNVHCNDRAWTGIDFSQMRRSRNIKICVCHASFVSFERLMPLTCTWQNVR